MPPPPPTLTFDHLTLKLVCESHLGWGTFLPNGHARLLRSGIIRYVRDERTDRQTGKSNTYCLLPYGRGHNNDNGHYGSRDGIQKLHTASYNHSFGKSSISCFLREVIGTLTPILWQIEIVVTSAKTEVMRSGWFVCHLNCLSFCQSVCQQDYCKVISRFRRHVVLWLGLVNFWWRSDPGYGFQITFLLPSPLQQNRGFLGDLVAYVTQLLTDIHDTAKWLTPKVNNLRNFGSNLAEIRKIRIQISDHFWLRFWP